MTDLSSRSWTGFATVDEAVQAIAEAKMVVVVDSPDRENEGDLVMAADCVEPEDVNFMAKYGRGLICVPMLGPELARLEIPPVTHSAGDRLSTAFHVGVDHVSSKSGISAEDRARTVRSLADPEQSASSFRQPGRVLPLNYREGGVLRRPGHTEASVDLAVLAGRSPAAMICEIAGDDGEMLRLPGLMQFAADHDLPVLAITDLVEHRRRADAVVERVGETSLPHEQDDFRMIGYRDRFDGREHTAIVFGDPAAASDAPVHIHPECLEGDVFGSRSCGCAESLATALRLIAQAGAGVVVYLRSEAATATGRDQQAPTACVPHDHRPRGSDCDVAAQILADLGIHDLRLLDLDRALAPALTERGLRVEEPSTATTGGGGSDRRHPLPVLA